MRADDVRRVLARDFPEIDTRNVLGPSSGTSNECFQVDGRWMFRFPKDDESREELRREVFALGKVRALLPARVPDHVFTPLGPDVEPAEYVGYTRIEGQPLLPETLASLDPARRRVFVADLAGFLTTLHEVPLEAFEREARAQGLSFREDLYVHESWIGSGSRLPPLEAILDALQADPLHDLISEICQPYIGHPDVFQEEDLCLVHGDLSEHHLLHDPATGHLLGVIDFGNVKIDDSWSDFLNLLSCYDPGFSFEVLDQYPRSSASLIRRRLELFGRLRSQPGNLLGKLYEAGKGVQAETSGGRFRGG